MKRVDVLLNLEKINKELNNINGKKPTRAYISATKYIDSIGTLQSVDTISDLVKAKLIVTKELNVDELEFIVKSMGLSYEEISEVIADDRRFLGLTAGEWNIDFDTKLQELRENIKIDKLESSAIILTNYLSDDDKFSMDTNGIDTLIGSL